MVDPARSKYYLYDDSVTGNLGGLPIVTGSDNGRVVRTIELTDAQAKYWLGQGVIGAKPLWELAPDAQRVHSEFTAGGVPAPKEVAKEQSQEQPTAGDERVTGQVQRDVTFEDKSKS